MCRRIWDTWQKEKEKGMKSNDKMSPNIECTSLDTGLKTAEIKCNKKCAKKLSLTFHYFLIMRGVFWFIRSFFIRKLVSKVDYPLKRYTGKWTVKRVQHLRQRSFPIVLHVHGIQPCWALMWNTRSFTLEIRMSKDERMKWNYHKKMKSKICNLCRETDRTQLLVRVQADC